MTDEMRPDVAAAWDRVTNKMGKKRDIRKLPEYLADGESVLVMAGGTTGGHAGLLVATDRRTLFVSEGVVNHSFEDFPYDRINTVISTRGVMFAKVSINSGGQARVIEQVPKAEAEAVAGVIRERVETVTRERSQPPAGNPAGASQPPSLAAQLRELAELRDQGILSADEFEAQKARLLAG